MPRHMHKQVFETHVLAPFICTCRRHLSPHMFRHISPHMPERMPSGAFFWLPGLLCGQVPRRIYSYVSGHVSGDVSGDVSRDGHGDVVVVRQRSKPENCFSGISEADMNLKKNTDLKINMDLNINMDLKINVDLKPNMDLDMSANMCVDMHVT